MQHRVHEVLQENPTVAQAPEVFGFVKTDDVRAIKMEKLSGFSLAQFLQNPESYSLPNSFDIDSFFQKIEDALQILNEKGYFHRDLNGNAGNIYITLEGDPYIIDFGSAVKSITPDESAQVYQLTPNGAYYHGTDISGVRELKKRLLQQQLSS
jgi:serine/threonine protein kinase